MLLATYKPMLENKIQWKIIKKWTLNLGFKTQILFGHIGWRANNRVAKCLGFKVLCILEKKNWSTFILYFKKAWVIEHLKGYN